MMLGSDVSNLSTTAANAAAQGLSVVVPLYNEAAGLELLHRRLGGRLRERCNRSRPCKEEQESNERLYRVRHRFLTIENVGAIACSRARHKLDYTSSCKGEVSSEFIARLVYMTAARLHGCP